MFGRDTADTREGVRNHAISGKERFEAVTGLRALLICHPTQSAPALPVLTNARDVQALPPQEAKREYPVQLRAIVTYVDTGPGELFVQDNSSGIFVFIRDSTSDAPLRTGQLVAIRGVATQGLEFEEAEVRHAAANACDDLRTQQNIRVHLAAPQIEKPACGRDRQRQFGLLTAVITFAWRPVSPQIRAG